MAGQPGWNNVGAATNAFMVRPTLEKKIYYESTWKTIFGKLNANREIVTKKLAHASISEDVANSSMIWEKQFGSGSSVGNEVRYIMREDTKGMPNYGEVAPAAGPYAQYKHSQCWINEVKSLKYPIIGSESQEKIREVMDDVVTLEKANINVWRAQEVDLEGFRSLLGGASRNLLLTTDGGMGTTLFGGAAGQQRSCYNFYVAGETTMVTPSATLATHEQAVRDKVVTLHDDDKYAFVYGEHEKLSYWVTSLGLKPVSIGTREYRAIVFTDPRNTERLAKTGGVLASMWENAWTRGSDNPALFKMKALELDDILYIPLLQMEYFRPTDNTTGLLYGCGYTIDPRDAYTNTSNITLSIVCGAGAVLRAMEKRVWFTTSQDDHTGAADYCVHYRDGMMRREWFTQDGRTVMKNDSSFVMAHYDPGVGVDYAP